MRLTFSRWDSNFKFGSQFFRFRAVELGFGCLLGLDINDYLILLKFQIIIDLNQSFDNKYHVLCTVFIFLVTKTLFSFSKKVTKILFLKITFIIKFILSRTFFFSKEDQITFLSIVPRTITLYDTERSR